MNVISITVSADFLQMDSLVNLCADFIAQNIVEIAKLPIDMSCLNSNLLKKIGRVVDAELLDGIKERKDRIVSKLYMKKLEDLLDEENNLMHRCFYCNTLFTNKQRSWMTCSKAEIFIDFHGSVIAQHVADRNFDLSRFINYLQEKKQLSWRDIYWRIWARLMEFDCVSCESKFVGAELAHCSYHPQNPRFNAGSNVGRYGHINDS